MSEAAKRGFRGYISSRPVRGMHVPQRLQNLLVRDYAARHGYRFLLSATEYVMPACYMILQNVLDELPVLEGIVVFSIFMLPERRARRMAIYERVLAQGAQLHAALENLALAGPADVARFEDVVAISAELPRAPFGASIEHVADPAYAWISGCAKTISGSK